MDRSCVSEGDKLGMRRFRLINTLFSADDQKGRTRDHRPIDGLICSSDPCFSLGLWIDWLQKGWKEERGGENKRNQRHNEQINCWRADESVTLADNFVQIMIGTEELLDESFFLSVNIIVGPTEGTWVEFSSFTRAQFIYESRWEN